MEEFSFLSDVYIDIYNWFASSTPGDHITEGYFIRKDKMIWNKIRKKFIELEQKSYLSKIEKDFLKCKYIGKAYRKINYFKKRKGHVYPIDCYQSCSKTLSGLKKVSMFGDVIVIELISNDNSYSIDIIKILKFMYSNNLIKFSDERDREIYNIENLEKYIDEEEVLVRISKENIINICMKNFENNININIDKKNWYRARIN